MLDQNITLVVAIVGCVTGIGGLLLNFYKALSERPKVEIELFRPYVNGFISNSTPDYSCKHMLAVAVRLMNTGHTPYPIISIAAVRGSMLSKAVPKYNSSLPMFQMPSGGSVDYFHGLSPLSQIPFVLNPGDVLQRVLIFPFVDDIVKQPAVKVIFRSPSWKKCVHVSVMELTGENIKEYIKKHAKQLKQL